MDIRTRGRAIVRAARAFRVDADVFGYVRRKQRFVWLGAAADIDQASTCVRSSQLREFCPQQLAGNLDR